jgi:hypothetical protein
LVSRLRRPVLEAGDWGHALKLRMEELGGEERAKNDTYTTKREMKTNAQIRWIGNFCHQLCHCLSRKKWRMLRAFQWSELNAHAFPIWHPVMATD